MTATLSRRPDADPPPSEPTGTPTPPRGPVASQTASPIVTAGTEVALAAVTAAAALGLARLFADGSFAGPVLLAVFSAHAVAWGCRRLGLGLLTSALVSAAGLALAVAWLVVPHTTTLLLPTGETFRAVSDDLRVAWQQFADVKAPTPPLRGFVLAAVVGCWIAATTSDFFAFRMRARFEAMAPAFTLFVFGSILGADNLRLPTTALYLATLLAYVLWSEAARQSASSTWFAGRAREGTTALLRYGAGLAVNAVIIALVVGPQLPGAGSAGLVSWRDTEEGGSRSRVTVSPLVDIRGRLVDQSDLELFTVGAQTPNYWRLTSLDRFDGAIWSSLGTYQPSRGTLPGAGAGRSVQQDYDIGNLGTIWLPAAYRAERVTGVRGARFDRDSGSLLAEATTADELRYTVVSSVPELTAAQLEAAPDSVPSDVAEQYLALPATFSSAVAEEARRVTAGAVKPYDVARRLQDYFRGPSFAYDLNVAPGHGVDAMERFLFQTRRGYCEQFAGTYAAMARAVGLPARVAVGFVPGTYQGDGLYHVQGRDAHAWPEVYIAGYGWVAFEPTPGAGRNAPGTQAYTGVGATPASSDPELTTTTAPPTTAAGSTPTSIAEEEAPPEPEGGSSTDSGGSPLRRAPIALALLATAYLIGVPAARMWLVRRRRQKATTASEQVLAVWQETESALSLAGYPRRASETPGEFAGRSAPVVGEAAPHLTGLAEDTTAAGFSVSGLPAEAVPRAEHAAETVVAYLKNQAGPAKRLRWALDPRPLVDAIRPGPGRTRA